MLVHTLHTDVCMLKVCAGSDGSQMMEMQDYLANAQ